VKVGAQYPGRSERVPEGAPGIDGLRCEDLKGWLQSHWQSVKAALLDGTYPPATPAFYLNRRMRNRTSGGVRGLRG